MCYFFYVTFLEMPLHLHKDFKHDKILDSKTMSENKRCKSVIFHIAIVSAHYLAALIKSICYLSFSIIKPKSHVRLAFSICCMICLGTNSRGMTADLKMIHSVNRRVRQERWFVQILQMKKVVKYYIYFPKKLLCSLPDW